MSTNSAEPLSALVTSHTSGDAANNIDKTADIACPVHLYLGGSFDPIHNSHMAMLTHVYQQVAPSSWQQHSHLGADTDKVQAYFLPTPRSPLKSKSTPPQHRLNMLELAISELTQALPLNQRSAFAVCDHELWQTPPVYTIDTLRQLRQNHPKHSLIFIMGADNIASLSKWREAETLIDYAHLWVIPRDQLHSKQAITDLLPAKLKTALVDTNLPLKKTTHGSIYIDSHGVSPISSSGIRDAFTQAQTDIAKSALPHSVYSYIMKNNLYDVN